MVVLGAGVAPEALIVGRIVEGDIGGSGVAHHGITAESSADSQGDGEKQKDNQARHDEPPAAHRAHFVFPV